MIRLEKRGGVISFLFVVTTNKEKTTTATPIQKNIPRYRDHLDNNLSLVCFELSRFCN